MPLERKSPEARNLEVLHAIVQAYIETGEPVASRTVARRRRNALSPASIRNIMADLSDEGYLSQPHTSAGRVPTQKAIVNYVKSLAMSRLLVEELERLKGQLDEADTLEDRVERSSHMLTEMTRNVGIAAAIPTSSQTLDHVELLPLADRRVLMVVVTRDRLVRNRVVGVDEPMTADELASIRNYLNGNFRGWTLAEIRTDLQARLEKDSAAYDAILKKLAMLCDKGLLDVGQSSAEVHMEGTANLMGLNLRLTREKMRELFLALEEKKRILQLLDQFLESPSGDLSVQVGLGDVHPSMKELSLIGLHVALPGGLSAKIAVLGPTRMNYEKVMSAVLHVGQAFQSLPE